MSTWILILWASMGVSVAVGPFETLEQCEAVRVQWLAIEKMNTKRGWCLEVHSVQPGQTDAE